MNPLMLFPVLIQVFVLIGAVKRDEHDEGWPYTPGS
jgi:hypothetical protein